MSPFFPDYCMLLSSMFSDAGIGITYMYAFLLDGKGIMIIRTDETQKARELIKSQGLPYLCEKDFVR